jgi:para-aminobenzoate synthetase component 1
VGGANLLLSGGGIVADSNEEAEYQETFDKVNRILQQLES